MRTNVDLSLVSIAMFSSLLVVVLLPGIKYSVYAQQPNNTYDNYACGISIKYPSDWQKTELSDTYRQKSDTTDIVYFSPPSSGASITNSSSDAFVYVQISVEDLFGTKTLKGYTIRNMHAFEGLPKYNLLSSNSTYMGDYPAFQITFNSGSDLKSKQNALYKSLAVWTVQNNKAYQIRYDISDPTKFDNYLPAVKKMIESVKLPIPGAYLSEDYSIRC
jgi:hypothetical protein